MQESAAFPLSSSKPSRWKQPRATGECRAKRGGYRARALRELFLMVINTFAATKAIKGAPAARRASV